MLVRTRATATVAALAAALLSASPVSTADATTAQLPTSAAAVTGHVPTVVAHVSDAAIHLSVGHRLHAGRVTFLVKTRKGGHNLQILRLHHGYTLQQAGQDLGQAFKGDLAAIHRVDHRITFKGGASTRPGHPGEFSVKLRASRLVLLDVNSNSLTHLKVFGTPPTRPRVPSTSGITTFTYGFGPSKSVLAHSGWTRVHNRSDQPHFIVFQRVKNGTTNRMVRQYIKSGAKGSAPFGLRANTSVGVLSPGHGEVFHYNLPAGKYLLACFWPDDETGMPHFFMGMWKLLRLQ